MRKLLKKDWTELDNNQRALLRWIFAQAPLLRQAYFAQLKFQRIFKEQNPKKAMDSLDRWRRRLRNELFRYFKHLLLDTTENWRDEVKNYLRIRRGKFRLTNGFLEASHRQLKQRYRDGRGNTGFQRWPRNFGQGDKLVGDLTGA
ncbi:MAG: transposase [Aestuariivirga sp.]|uniref:transposase n=1 Tax=Aestuariivirga sp. TaxID=2650926 RepID=UPI0038D165FF